MSANPHSGERHSPKFTPDINDAFQTHRVVVNRSVPKLAHHTYAVAPETLLPAPQQTNVRSVGGLATRGHQQSQVGVLKTMLGHKATQSSPTSAGIPELQIPQDYVERGVKQPEGYLTDVASRSPAMSGPVAAGGEAIMEAQALDPIAVAQRLVAAAQDMRQSSTQGMR